MGDKNPNKLKKKKKIVEKITVLPTTSNETTSSKEDQEIVQIIKCLLTRVAMKERGIYH
jgi:hypothetical protein